MPGHVLEDLGERGHRVAGEEPAPGRDHRLGDGLAPLRAAGARARRSWPSRSLTPVRRRSGVLVLVDLEDEVGADLRAGPAPGAPGTEPRVAVAAGVHLVRGHHQHPRRAGVDAEVAPLAGVDVDHHGPPGGHGGGPRSSRPPPPASCHAGPRRRRAPQPTPARSARSLQLDVLGPVGGERARAPRRRARRARPAR